MRSTRGLAAAIILLLTVPVAIAVAVALGAGAEAVIHFGIGAGMVLLATAAFDFGLPRPVAWFGAATTAAFGGIFLLQGVADALGNDALYNFAFFVLGQMPERILPELDPGLVRGAADPRQRGPDADPGRDHPRGHDRLGGLTLAGPVIGFDVPDIKLRWLLPFVWLLFESAKAAPRTASRSMRGASLAGSHAA